MGNKAVVVCQVSFSGSGEKFAVFQDRNDSVLTEIMSFSHRVSFYLLLIIVSGENVSHALALLLL